MTIEKLIKDRFDNMFLRNKIKIGVQKQDFFVSFLIIHMIKKFLKNLLLQFVIGFEFLLLFIELVMFLTGFTLLITYYQEHISASRKMKN